MMGNMFKKVDQAPKTPAKKKGKEKTQLQAPGLMQLAILDALIKTATTMQETIKTEVAEVGFTHFVTLAGKQSDRPSSFEGVDGQATASLEVRKRSEKSVLTEDEVKTLQGSGLDVKEKIVQPFQFYINPAYATNEALLSKVEKAIEKIVPGDFIQQQEEIKKPIVSDEMLNDAFKKGLNAEVLRILTCCAVKPKLTAEYDMQNLIKDALNILQPPEEKPAAKVEKTTKMKRVK